MANNEIWDSALRSAGDLAGVFEFDGETGYFYLYQQAAKPMSKITGAIHILSGTPDFTLEDIAIRWSADEEIVGLIIRLRLWAAFDCKSGAKYGGDYQLDGSADIPVDIIRKFTC